MQLHFQPGQNFECSGCAKCCTCPWHIAVDEPSRRVILELPVAGGLTEAANGQCITTKVDGNCSFLTEDRLCRIHAQAGARAKPSGCQQFPFLLQHTPDGVQVSVSFFCSAAQRNEGRPLETYEDELRQLLAEHPAPAMGPIWVKDGTYLSWPGYLQLEAALTDRGRLKPVTLQLALAPDGRWTPEQLGEILDGPLPAHPDLGWLELAFVAGLLSRLEASDPSRGGEVLQALMEDRAIPFKAGWTGRLSELYAQRRPIDWLEAELDRYFRALMFRRFLVARKGVLENLIVLQLVLQVAELYTHLGALARQAAEPELADWHAALDRCEMSLITHGSEAFVMSHSYPGFLRQRLGL